MRNYGLLRRNIKMLRIMMSACLLHAHLNFSLYRKCAAYLKYTFLFKDSIWHFARYHKWQHQRRYMTLRSLTQVAARKTVYGTSLVITSDSTKDGIWPFARYHKWQHQRKSFTSIDHVVKWSVSLPVPICVILYCFKRGCLILAIFILFLVNQIFHDKLMTLQNIKLKKR
jgi:hypothetical protein